MDKEPSCRSTQRPLTYLAKILTCYDHTDPDTNADLYSNHKHNSNPDLTMTLILTHDLDYIYHPSLYEWPNCDFDPNHDPNNDLDTQY